MTKKDEKTSKATDSVNKSAEQKSSVTKMIQLLITDSQITSTAINFPETKDGMVLYVTALTDTLLRGASLLDMSKDALLGFIGDSYDNFLKESKDATKEQETKEDK